MAYELAPHVSHCLEGVPQARHSLVAQCRRVLIFKFRRHIERVTQEASPGVREAHKRRPPVGRIALPCQIALPLEIGDQLTRSLLRHPGSFGQYGDSRARGIEVWQQIDMSERHSLISTPTEFADGTQAERAMCPQQQTSQVSIARSLELLFSVPPWFRHDPLSLDTLDNDIYFIFGQASLLYGEVSEKQARRA